MKKALLGLLIIGAVVVAYFFGKSKTTTEIKDTGLVQEKLKNVSKLIVSEGHYSDIITYKNAKEIYLSWLKAEKKAVVLVNATATVSYNLKELEFSVNEETKTISITKIPEPELKITPKLEYYDIQADFLNEFTPKDYNEIAEVVDQKIKKQINNSRLISNSKNRLVSEIYALLNREGMHWKVVFEDRLQLLD